jgi:hypothetical protein
LLVDFRLSPDFPERLGGAAVVMEAAEATENLVVIWVDQGFSGENFSRVIQQLHFIEEQR